MQRDTNRQRECSGRSGISRRRFVRRGGLAVAGVLLGGRVVRAAEPVSAGPLPTRTLGRTGVEVPTLALGTWPSGMCRAVSVEDLVELVHTALDLGVTYVDTARNYNKAEEAIGRALGRHRKEVFLTTKVWADTAEQAQRSFETSLRLLKTDHVDLVYLHSLGNRNVATATAPGGALEYLLKQKKKGTARFIGVSGHSRPGAFPDVLKSGHVDVVMVAMNFVDRYVYGFETKVLPVANQLNLGVAAMKVFGGMRGGFGAAVKPNPGPYVEPNRLELAVRYALGLPGVATLVIGVHAPDQLRRNVQMVRNFRPLEPAEKDELERLGKQLAPQWGPRHGPVV